MDVAALLAAVAEPLGGREGVVNHELSAEGVNPAICVNTSEPCEDKTWCQVQLPTEALADSIRCLQVKLTSFLSDTYRTQTSQQA